MGFSVRTRIKSIRTIGRSIRYVLAACLVMTGLLAAGGCVGSSAVSGQDVITVTGNITVRGNEPFTETVLITDDDNWYLLDMSAEMRNGLMTPARAQVTGAIRLGEWNGRPFTRMQVAEIELLQE